MIVSSTAPTESTASTVAVNEPVSSTPLCSKGRQSRRVNVTVYAPGRRRSMRYRPEASVTAERTFSMSAGLAASTATPGMGAPETSRTVPAMAAWANATPGITVSQKAATTVLIIGSGRGRGRGVGCVWTEAS